jgi:tetratricopeptide (TPR) repeat protein
MEIGEFIEQDILIFLDDRTENEEIPSRPGAQPILYLTRDYEKELLASLGRDELQKAKHILHDLKEQFDNCPSGTPDKARVKALLMKLYDIFKDHLDAQHIPLATAAVATPTPKPDVKPDADIAVLLYQLEEHLGTGQIREAIETYRKAKHTIASNEPVETRLRLLTLYGRIKQAIVDIEEKESPRVMEEPRKQTTPPAPSITHAEVEPNLDEQLLLQLERQKRGMETMLHKEDLHGAMQEYRKMRIIAQQLRDPRTAHDAAAKLERIYGILDALRKHTDESMLRAVP